MNNTQKLKAVAELSHTEYTPHYLGGRCWNGAHRDAGRVVHAVKPLGCHGSNMGKSLCGRKPGARSYGWAETTAPINCPKCVNAVAEIAGGSDGNS